MLLSAPLSNLAATRRRTPREDDSDSEGNGNSNTNSSSNAGMSASGLESAMNVMRNALREKVKVAMGGLKRLTHEIHKNLLAQVTLLLYGGTDGYLSCCCGSLRQKPYCCCCTYFYKETNVHEHYERTL